MRNFAMLYPMFALALWTAIVVIVVTSTRGLSVLRRQVRTDDFRAGESSAVPASVSVANRNLVNLLELPTLFYVVCLLLFVTAGASRVAVLVAWAFVALRVLHSLIHLSYNRVMHRLFVFSLSCIALAVLWVMAFVHVAANAPM